MCSREAEARARQGAGGSGTHAPLADPLPRRSAGNLRNEIGASPVGRRGLPASTSLSSPIVAPLFPALFPMQPAAAAAAAGEENRHTETGECVCGALTNAVSPPCFLPHPSPLRPHALSLSPGEISPQFRFELITRRHHVDEHGVIR